MPHIVTLMESISKQIIDPGSQITLYLSILDLKYAYSQQNLNPVTANHCNFNKINGYMSSTFRF